MSVEQTMPYTYYRANQSIFITNEQTMFEIGMSVEQTMYYTYLLKSKPKCLNYY